MEPAEMDSHLELHRKVHVTFLKGGLGQLSAGFAALDAGRPWICYWIVHGLALLNAPLPASISADDVADFLACCQHPGGGFGGSPMQLAHMAPTYASVCALVTMCTTHALSVIDRVAMLEFIERMIIPPAQGGGFTVHEGKHRPGAHTFGWSAFRSALLACRQHYARLLVDRGGTAGLQAQACMP